MVRKIIFFLGLASPLMAQLPSPTGVTTSSLATATEQPAGTEVVQKELNSQKLKLKMPVGASSVSFDLSDSARRSMIGSPAILNFSDQIQLTSQDSVTMRGLMDLPIAALSEVVSKMDFYTQIRFVRFGLLQVTDKPQEARIYASKLYILTDEIFPRKAVLDSMAIASALAADRLKFGRQQPQAVTSIQNEPVESKDGILTWLILLLLTAAGSYYWFVLRPKPVTHPGSPSSTEEQNVVNAQPLVDTDEIESSEVDEEAIASEPNGQPTANQRVGQ